MDIIASAHQEQARDIRDLKKQRQDDDLRIATLAQVVDSLQDAAEQADKVSKALAAEHEKRTKMYAAFAVLTSPVVAIVVPLLLKWLAGLVVGAP